MKQKSMKQNKCIFYTINPEVISPCLTSVNSFLSHNSGYDVKIFACNFVTNFSKRISTLLSKLKELHSDSNIEIIYKETKNTVSSAGWFSSLQGIIVEKFKLLKVLKEEYDLVIYSDPDVIFRKSVSDIENYVEKDPGLYASEEQIDIYTLPWVKYVIRKFDKTKYFNCGFLVLNSDIHDYSEEIYKKVNKALGRYNFCPEQNYMNFDYEVKPLKNEHNYLWCNKITPDPVSVHYFNVKKPYSPEKFSLSFLPYMKHFEPRISRFFNDYFKYEIK